jgi:hypothetical protein
VLPRPGYRGGCDYYDMPLGKWVVESGTVKLMAGGSSANLPLSGTVQVNGY